MSDVKIMLISDRCKDCPNLELETIKNPVSHNIHRCKHVQFCRKILGFWKEQSRIEELEITQYKDVSAKEEEEFLPLFGDGDEE